MRKRKGTNIGRNAETNNITCTTHADELRNQAQICLSEMAECREYDDTERRRRHEHALSKNSTYL